MVTISISANSFIKFFFFFSEHNRFLEAIKLYGRAWQRIEEHIGTKTAVQIRSHAQKFFSKLEKEALLKGMPLGQACEIDIPPPRPKRKPNNPYPRKTSSDSPSSVSVGLKDGSFLVSTSSSHSSKPIQDLENDLHLEPSKKTSGKEFFDLDDNSSGVLTLSQETSCTSLSPSIKSPPKIVELKAQSIFRDSVPFVKEESNEGGRVDKYLLDTDVEETHRIDATCTDLDDGLGGTPISSNSRKYLDEEVIKGNRLKQQEDLCQSNQNYPRHIPIHVLESSTEACTESPPPTIPQLVGTENSEPSTCVNTGSHSTISTQQPLPLHPSTTNNQESYNLSNFSNLIVSTLLQNPAAHAAASFAASLWPFTNVKTTTDGADPSTSAIAAATVMAASAWWAAHGLLPLCPPLQSAAFTCVPPPIVPCPTDPSLPWVDPGGPTKVIEPKLSDNKSSVVSLSYHNNKNDSAGSDNAEPNKPHSHEQKLVSSTKGKTKEQVDRSSCGSNTPSGSEAEMDMNADGKDESKEPNNNNNNNVNEWIGEPNNYRSSCRSTGGNINESWKEVSQEGKLAFKALFSRQVLPQSFSPPKSGIDNREQQLMRDDDKLRIDLNSKTPLTCIDDDDCEGNIDKVELMMGIEKPKARRAGFKPYKRCSMESSSVTNGCNQVEERDPKRLCLQGKGSA
ncbi:CCA tRNA nucleotidyltransferase [Ranunculus cassubicifolius]